MTTPLSSHATLLDVQLTPGGAWTEIAELGDFDLPELDHNEFDASVHNRNIDNYVMGIFRRGAMTFPINFIPTDNTHDHLTGLIKLNVQSTITGFRARFPDGTQDGTPWVMSGQVKTFKPTAPVDGKLTAQITLRFSGYMSIGGVLIGT